MGEKYSITKRIGFFCVFVFCCKSHNTPSIASVYGTWIIYSVLSHLLSTSSSYQLPTQHYHNPPPQTTYTHNAPNCSNCPTLCPSSFSGPKPVHHLILLWVPKVGLQERPSRSGPTCLPSIPLCWDLRRQRWADHQRDSVRCCRVCRREQGVWGPWVHWSICLSKCGTCNDHERLLLFIAHD